MKNSPLLRVLLTGELLVNVPVPIIMVCAGYLFQSYTVSFYWGLGVGFVVAIAYRLKAHTAWRHWALTTGVNEISLHRYATYGLLGWKREEADIPRDLNPEDRARDYD